jgi:uncharacterized protein YihD (DUF1040 family)
MVMRDPNRIDEILTWLREEWEKNPDIRLGQLIANLSPAFVRSEAKSLFYLEDNYWLRKARGE